MAVQNSKRGLANSALSLLDSPVLATASQSPQVAAAIPVPVRQLGLVLTCSLLTQRPPGMSTEQECATIVTQPSKVLGD